MSARSPQPPTSGVLTVHQAYEYHLTAAVRERLMAPDWQQHMYSFSTLDAAIRWLVPLLAEVPQISHLDGFVDLTEDDSWAGFA